MGFVNTSVGDWDNREENMRLGKPMLGIGECDPQFEIRGTEKHMRLGIGET